MNTRDDEVVVRSLETLALHAPRYRGLPPTAPEPAKRRYRTPLLAAATVVVLTIAATSLGSLAGSDDPTDTAPSTPSDSRVQQSPTPSEAPMRLAAVSTWRHEQAPDCSAWEPAEGDAVVDLARLDDACFAKAPRSSTTVLLAPYEPRGPFGTTWAEVTTPWRTLGSHQVARLSSGPLLEMNSRVVDAITCVSCDQVIVVLGPDPAAVHALIESATD